MYRAEVAVVGVVAVGCRPEPEGRYRLRYAGFEIKNIAVAGVIKLKQLALPDRHTLNGIFDRSLVEFYCFCNDHSFCFLCVLR